ncbi:HalOD1 output domain-containing protein [Halobacterium wangiae]|uniref:HalOD1 output domain-containing protein n=1 Tax=Halobacterium wangiae TaxID=2902623 RepID=UPI001E54D381|nr:HalOD1 output domain-containing protein [Halobacterium wangiae]
MPSDKNVSRDTTSSEPDTGIFRSDWTSYGNPSTAVAEAVAEATGKQQTDLDPLQHSVDADALDALLANSDSPRLELSFTYEGVDVRITGAGVIEIWT